MLFFWCATTLKEGILYYNFYKNCTLLLLLFLFFIYKFNFYIYLVNVKGNFFKNVNLINGVVLIHPFYVYITYIILVIFIIFFYRNNQYCNKVFYFIKLNKFVLFMCSSFSLLLGG